MEKRNLECEQILCETNRMLPKHADEKIKKPT